MQKEVEELGELPGNYKATVEEYKYQEKNWQIVLREHNDLLRGSDKEIGKLKKQINKVKKGKQ